VVCWFEAEAFYRPGIAFPNLPRPLRTACARDHPGADSRRPCVGLGIGTGARKGAARGQGIPRTGRERGDALARNFILSSPRRALSNRSKNPGVSAFRHKPLISLGIPCLK